VKTEILYGIHPVIEALKAKRRAFANIYLSKRKPAKWVDTVYELAGALKVTVEQFSLPQLQSITHTDLHQGVAARVSLYPWADFSEIMPMDGSRPDARNLRRFLLLLDHVVDPHNLGALVRTAHCVGVDGILVPKDRSAPPTAVVSKVSAGALEHVRMAHVTNMVRTIQILKQQGLWIIGLDRWDGESIFAFQFPPAVAILIGGEHKGIRPLIKRHCDHICSIPQIGNIDSLNASVAGAIAMYEVFRQQRAHP